MVKVSNGRFDTKVRIDGRLDPQQEDDELGTITFTITNLPATTANAILVAGRNALRDIVIEKSKNVGATIHGVREFVPERTSKK